VHIVVSHSPFQRALAPEEVARIAPELPPMVAAAPVFHGF
jgi:hypothetical protein